MPIKVAESFIGEYEIIGPLGVGGMGEVYRARQFNLMREVALKLLPPEYCADAEYIERFLGEARAAAQLNHPNIVQVYDAGVFEGRYFIVMELVNGRNIAEIIRDEKRISERDAVRILIQAALGLGFAHQAGVIHRDVKPDNLIMNLEGTVKICDLGLAKWGVLSVDQRITQSGMTVGTPHYIAPEQTRGVDVDHRADIYALGATFYHMLTGQKPFDGDDNAEIMGRQLKEPFPDPRLIHSDISDEALQLLNKMTEKNIENRFQSMDEVVDAACQIIGAKEVEGMVGPEVARRLARRFMEKKAKRTNIITRFSWKKQARHKKMAILAILLLLGGGGGIIAWSHVDSIRFEHRLTEVEQAMRLENQHQDRRSIVKQVEIQLPTEISSVRKRGDKRPSFYVQNLPGLKSGEEKGLSNELKISGQASGSISANPSSACSATAPKQVVFDIPRQLIWQVSISPLTAGDEKIAGKSRRTAKTKPNTASNAQMQIPQLIKISSESRGLMKLDMVQMLKADANASGFTHAWLVVTPSTQRIKMGNFDMELYRLARPWGQQIDTISDGPVPRPEIGGVDWEYAQPSVRWGFNGADKESAELPGFPVDRAKNPSATTVLSPNTPQQSLKFDVTEDIRAWLAGTPNYGWVFVGKGLGVIELYPGSDTSGRGPKLIFTFD